VAGEDTWFGSERFLHAAVLLSGTSEPRVQLVVLKSYDQASQYVTRLDHVLLGLGAVLLLLSGAVAVYLSTTITRPLDRLVAGARALGGGNFDYQLQRAGAREIRELGDAFDRMRARLRTAREELLSAERSATIGQMASSISHDLRHYLSAVYANAEFLGYDSIGPTSAWNCSQKCGRVSGYDGPDRVAAAFQPYRRVLAADLRVIAVPRRAPSPWCTPIRMRKTTFCPRS
jgi:signal transduction histidine kinase